MTNSKFSTLLRLTLALFALSLMLTVLLLALLTTAARAEMTWEAVNRAFENSRILPPPEYDYPFRGQLIAVRKPAELMKEICPRTILPTTLACAVRFNEGKACVVIIGDDALIEKGPWPYDIILRHEVGHCNGWAGSHPNARRYQNEYEPRLIPTEAQEPRLMPTTSPEPRRPPTLLQRLFPTGGSHYFH
jgi:hypothetical protein